MLTEAKDNNLFTNTKSINSPVKRLNLDKLRDSQTRNSLPRFIMTSTAA